MGSLLLLLGCGSPTGPVLLSSESCSGQTANAVVTFEDAGLEDAVSDAVERTRPPLGVLGTRDRLDLTCGRVSGLTLLDGHGSDRIGSLLGIQNLTSLQVLHLGGHSLTDISLLSGLTSLTELELEGNPDLSNIQPLLSNTGLRADDLVRLQGTNVSCADVAALRAKVRVRSDCP